MKQGPELNGTSWVCEQCIGDADLWARLAEDAEEAASCAMGHAAAPCVTVEQLAAVIDPVYRQLYEPGDHRPVFGLDDDRKGWEQEGESPTFLIQELAEVEEEIADAVVAVLADEEAYAVAKDGGTAFYDASQNYVETPDYPHEHHLVWRGFVRNVKFSRRYIDPDVRRTLAELLDHFPEEWDQSGIGPRRTIMPGELSIYRARSASTEEEAAWLLRSPLQELGPPPAARRTPGRLNAGGIGVFYGGLSPDVCVAELRPSLQSLVVVARFELLKSIEVFDLTAFDRHSPYGGPFRPGYMDERDRWQFLRSFHWEITQPVRPESEFLEYVPTQIVAEYLHAELGYDAVIYRSAQIGGYADPELDSWEVDAGSSDLLNIALFGADGMLKDASDSVAEPEPAWPDTFWEMDGGVERGRSEPLLHLAAQAPDVYRITRISYEKEPAYVRAISEDGPSGGLPDF